MNFDVLHTEVAMTDQATSKKSRSNAPSVPKLQKAPESRGSHAASSGTSHVAETDSRLYADGEDADQSLSERAHRALMGMILSGELAPAEVITERQIAIQLGVSRTPLREAIRRLEGARLLERQRSGVLVVRALPIEEYISILDVRRLLESEAARLAAGQIAQEELERLRRRAEAVLALPEQAAILPAAEDEDLHLMIAASAGNPVLEEMILALRTRTAMFRFGRFPARRREVMHEHLAIVAALSSGNGLLAQRAMEQHLDQVRATIIARLMDSRRRD